MSYSAITKMYQALADPDAPHCGGKDFLGEFVGGVSLTYTLKDGVELYQ